MVVVVLDGHYVLGVVGCDIVWIAVVGRCNCGWWWCGCGGGNGGGCCGYCYGLDGGVTGFKMLFISIILMFHMQK